MNCINCGAVLTSDEIAVNRKLINRGTEKCMCIACLSRFFSVDERLVREKIEFFKKEGCTLFQ